MNLCIIADLTLLIIIDVSNLLVRRVILMGGQKAFTLIELMVVVVVIGVIGMIAYPSVMRVLRGMEDD